MSSEEAVHVSPYGGNTGRGRRDSGHLAVSLSAICGPWWERLWRQKQVPLDTFVKMKLDSAS